MRYLFYMIFALSLYAQEVWHHEMSHYMSATLSEYQKYELDKSWYVHDSNITVKYGESHSSVSALKSQLVLEGDIVAKKIDAKNPNRFDTVLSNGLISYQKRHGLKATGQLDSATRKELSTPLAQRIAILKLNKERIAGIHPSRGGWIVVNIPSATFDLMENNQTILSMKTVVGKPDRQTPLFDRRIVYSVVVNPTWTMPETVIREDMTKKISRSPDLFTEKNISVFQGRKIIDPKAIDWKTLNSEELMRYKYVQNSGAENPLGKVKFLFSNTKSIYMHDTTRHDLFSKRYRFASSGCIRLEKPDLLQTYILGKDFELPKESNIAIPVMKPLNVSVVYLTAWVDIKRRVHYREDIYSRDTLHSSNVREMAMK